MCRALRRAGRGVLKGGGSARGHEGRGAGGSSATFEGGRRRQRDSGGRGVGGCSATVESGDEAAARHRRVGRRRQRGYGGRGVGCSAVLEGGEEALVTVSRRDAFAV